MAFEKLSFTKDWKNASDFPTYEESEAQVRADLQALHDETRNFINNKLIPNIEGMAVPGAGDMLAAVYDPTGKKQDIFAYARAQAAAAAPSVPAWAQAATKPTYTAKEVGAAAANHTHNAGDIGAAPVIAHGTTDVTAGAASSYPEGTLYVVVE